MDNDGLSWILMDYGLSLAMDYRGFWTIRVVSWILDYHGIMADSGLSWYIMDYCGLWTIMDYFGLSSIIVGYPNVLDLEFILLKRLRMDRGGARCPPRHTSRKLLPNIAQKWEVNSL